MARAFQSCGASQIKVMKLLATRATFAFFFFSSRRRHTRWPRDWSSDVCSSDLHREPGHADPGQRVQCRARIDRVEAEARRRSEERRVGKECRSRWLP